MVSMPRCGCKGSQQVIFSGKIFGKSSKAWRRIEIRSVVAEAEGRDVRCTPRRSKCRFGLNESLKASVILIPPYQGSSGVHRAAQYFRRTLPVS